MRRHPSIALFFVALLVGACIPSTPSPSTEESGAPTASATSSEAQPSTGEAPSASTAGEQASASAAPSESATPSTAESSPSPSSEPGSAVACSGNDKNRAFFGAAAAAVNWTVYCAVLPAGWFVDSGQYRGSGGGWLQIAYKGPGGARLELHEGAFCAAADGCIPSDAGPDTGEANFGDRGGLFLSLDGGGWAVVVDRGQPVNWLAVGMGMNEATFRRLAGALTIVGG